MAICRNILDLQSLIVKAMYCTYNVTLRRVRAAIVVVEKR